MKTATALFLGAMYASIAAATPLEKRAYTTEIELFTVTVTVIGYPPAETPAATSVDAAPSAQVTPDDSEGSNWGGWGEWRGGSWSSDSASPTAAAPPADTPAFEAPSPPSAPESNSWSPSTPEAPAPVSTSVSSDYKQGILDSHNMHRSNASVPSLSWDDHMASIAAQIAASCVYAHDTSTGGGGYGQNIGAGAPPEDIPAMITNEMYNGEIGFYPGYGSEPDMSNFEKWGHYSQIVWKSTTGVGCATQYCPNGLANTGGNVSPYFTVCNYSPPGNFGGQYAENVLQPGNVPTVTL
ncbi:SCP-like extracellular protein [Cladophialophora carrionii]|uniref:SCP-like extracellular protein n=1 Tax=Cladophialophora carrionii TaxID=86049 RepID=A0A1C1CVF8_9EURO|nr:SCP-like extracellular protein [Cladophialophora carrionii]